MKRAAWLTLVVLTGAAWSCRPPQPRLPRELKTEILVRHTPIKQQGTLPTDWAYAMTSLIESDRLAVGDSVNLSAQSLVRAACYDAWLGRHAGARAVSPAGGTGFTALRLLRTYGLFTYDEYPDTLYPSAALLSRQLARATTPVRAQQLLDEALGYLPPMVHLYGAIYTPQELALSMTEPDTYEALMSDGRQPWFVVDRYAGVGTEGGRALNLPPDVLVDTVVSTLRRGYSLMWQGDLDETCCQPERGLALWPVSRRRTNARERQRDLDAGLTTLNHSMHLIGLARDAQGHRYFILKTAHGTGGRTHGYFLMGENYLRMKTVLLFRRHLRPLRPEP